MCRPMPIFGSATFTMEMSRTTMNCAPQATASTAHSGTCAWEFVRWPLAPTAAGPVDVFCVIALPGKVTSTLGLNPKKAPGHFRVLAR